MTQLGLTESMKVSLWLERVSILLQVFLGASSEKGFLAGPPNSFWTSLILLFSASELFFEGRVFMRFSGVRFWGFMGRRSGITQYGLKGLVRFG